MPCYKILMIDGDADIRKAHCSVLTGCGYKVLEAAILSEGRALLEKENPDLIIMETLMPDGSGLDFCRELRSVRELSYIPVMFVSILGSKQDNLIGFKAGCDDYLVKPCDPDILEIRVKVLLRSAYVYNRKGNRRNGARSPAGR